MHVVPAVSTPISAEHARDALLAASPGLDRESAALLLALIWVETGRGNLQNWNVGNITANDAWPGGAWRPPWFAPNQTSPHLAELHERMLRGQAPSAFRAYDSAPEGFRDFIAQLRHTFPTVLEAARTGNPATFVQALHDSNYSRDYTFAHVPTFAQLREHFGPLVASLPAGVAGAGGVASALGLALVLLALRRKRKRHDRANTHR